MAESSDLCPGEFQVIQSMLGMAKAKGAHTISGMRGARSAIDTGVSASAMLIFANCHDCDYVVNVPCTKILIQDCANTRITFNGKILTNSVDIYKAHGVQCLFNTKCGTLQVDLCSQLHLQFTSRELLHDVVWAGCHAMRVSFDDTGDTVETGFAEMLADDGDLEEEYSQFKLHYLKDRFVNEKIIRLANGFPTTKREKDAFDQKQEQTLVAMAAHFGIALRPKKTTSDASMAVHGNDGCSGVGLGP